MSTSLKRRRNREGPSRLDGHSSLWTRIQEGDLTAEQRKRLDDVFQAAGLSREDSTSLATAWPFHLYRAEMKAERRWRMVKSCKPLAIGKVKALERNRQLQKALAMLMKADSLVAEAQRVASSSNSRLPSEMTAEARREIRFSHALLEASRRRLLNSQPVGKQGDSEKVIRNRYIGAALAEVFRLSGWPLSQSRTALFAKTFLILVNRKSVNRSTLNGFIELPPEIDSTRGPSGFNAFGHK